MAPPRITLITPVLNQAGTLAETLGSVERQGYPEVEHVVIDGGSTDGTLELLRTWPEAQVFNGYGNNAAEYLRILDERLRAAEPVDILAVSAGFDAYKFDLGRLLDTEDYGRIGRLLKEHTLRLGHQRRFAVLEGGYYLPDLGSNVLAFCRGFQ